MNRHLSVGSEYRDAVLFSILALCWGTSFVAIEVGLEYVPPLLFAGLRYALAGVVVLGYAAVRTDRWRPVGRAEWLAAIVAGVFVIALYHALLYLGELYVSGAVAATVVSTAPILTAALAGSILPDERLTSTGVVGLALGLLGVIAVARPSPSGLETELVVGAGLVLAGAAAFAVGTVLARPLETSLPTATLQAWAMLAGAAVLLVAAPLRGESLAAISVVPPALIAFGYLTFVSSAFAFLLYFTLLERNGPTQVALVGYAEPVVAIGVSWLALGTVVDALTVVGLLAILAGFAVVERDALRRFAARRRSAGGAGPTSRPEARTDGGSRADSGEIPAERR